MSWDSYLDLNLIGMPLADIPSFHKILWILVHYFFAKSCKQTNKQTKTGGNMTFMAKVIKLPVGWDFSTCVRHSFPTLRLSLFWLSVISRTVILAHLFWLSVRRHVFAVVLLSDPVSCHFTVKFSWPSSNSFTSSSSCTFQSEPIKKQVYIQSPPWGHFVPFPCALGDLLTSGQI